MSDGAGSKFPGGGVAESDCVAPVVGPVMTDSGGGGGGPSDRHWASQPGISGKHGCAPNACVGHNGFLCASHGVLRPVRRSPGGNCHVGKPRYWGSSDPNQTFPGWSEGE